MAERGEEKSKKKTRSITHLYVPSCSFEGVSSTLRWSEDEMDEDSGDGEDYVAVASKKLKTNSSAHVLPRSQTTRSTRARPPTSKGIL